jgi:hypothetical protein
MTAEIWVALATGNLGFVVGVLDFSISRAQLKHQKQKLEHKEQQFEAQFALSREKMRLDHPDIGRIYDPDLSAIQTIRGLLQDKRYEGRSFATIGQHLPGRAGEEIRTLLRSMGALKLNGVPEKRWLLNTVQ